MTTDEAKLEALRLCMSTGDRYIESLMEVVASNSTKLLTSFVIETSTTFEDYVTKMRVAGYPFKIPKSYDPYFTTAMSILKANEVSE